MSSLLRRGRTAVFFFCFLLVITGTAASNEKGKAVGNDAAPITIEVFSDFGCPACADYHLETLRPLVENYVRTGKVFLVFRMTVSPSYRMSYRAALYANAAVEIDRFHEVSEVLFEKQKQWSFDGEVEAVVSGVLKAEEMDRLRNVLREGRGDRAVELDQSYARAYAVRATPTTFITHAGKTAHVVGAVSYPILRRYLDHLLEGSP
jgi:protein-disulfide isomerase